jgi:hypothetical protein
MLSPELADLSLDLGVDLVGAGVRAVRSVGERSQAAGLVCLAKPSTRGSLANDSAIDRPRTWHVVTSAPASRGSTIHPVRPEIEPEIG